MDSIEKNIYDIVIIGGGPAGIEAALQADKLKLNYLLIEKSYVGALIRDTMAEKKFYHEYGRNTGKLKGDLDFPDRLKGGELVALWQKQADKLKVEAATVLSIEKRDDLFTIRSTSKNYSAKRVILSSGTFENTRKLNVPGEENNPNIFYKLDYYNDYSDKTIIVVGGGNSAVETAIYHGVQNKIILVIRKDHFAENVTDKNKTDVMAMVSEGKVELFWQSKIVSISENLAKIDKAGATSEFSFDYMFINAGYEKPLEFLKQAGIEIEETIGGGKPKFNDKFETNVQNLYIAGSLTGADSVIESANQGYDIVHAIVG